MSKTYNHLLIKDDIGRGKPTIRDLPPPTHTYGKAEIKDSENAYQVTSIWKYHSQSRQQVNDKDFQKLNKSAIIEKATTAHKQYEFRRKSQMKLKETSGLAKMQNFSIKIPDESFTYGISNRPSTPMRNIVSNLYGDIAEQMMLTRYDLITKETRQNGRLQSANRHTRASALAKTFIHNQQVEENKYANKSLFKMKKFLNVEPRTNTNMGKRIKKTLNNSVLVK